MHTYTRGHNLTTSTAKIVGRTVRVRYHRSSALIILNTHAMN